MVETVFSAPLDADLAVIGAGPVGTALAVLAAKAGLRTVLVDVRSESAAPAADTRSFAIVRGSWRLLGAAGVHGDLKGLTEPLNGLEAVDGGTHWFGAPWAAFSNDDLPEGDREALGELVPAGALQAALDRKAGETEGLVWKRGARFSGYEAGPSGARVHLESGESFRCAVIAA